MANIPVIDEAEDIEVRLPGKHKNFDTELVGGDKATDVAGNRITAKGRHRTTVNGQ